jgi:hypothetical protein
MQSPRSNFLAFGSDIYSEVQSAIKQHSNVCHVDYKPNVLLSTVFIEKFITLYMPTLPLWSSVMLGNISRHSVQYCNWGNTKTASLEKCSIHNFQHTTGSQ